MHLEITLPDGSLKHVDPNTTPFEIARSSAPASPTPPS